MTQQIGIDWNQKDMCLGIGRPDLKSYFDMVNIQKIFNDFGKSQPMGECAMCGTEMVNTIQSQDADGNRSEWMLVCPACAE